MDTMTRRRKRPKGIGSPARMEATELGRRVKAARAYAGYNRVEDLARDVGIGRNKMIAIENGKTEPTRWVLIAISELCGLSRGWFFDEEVTDPSAAGPAALDEVADDLDRVDRRKSRSKGQRQGD